MPGSRWPAHVTFPALLVVVCSGCASMGGASTLLGGLPRSGGEAGGPPAGGGLEEPQIQPDRPDFTNAAYTVPPGLVQIEAGAGHSRVAVSGETTTTPISLRAGVARWFEASVDSDGLTRNKQALGTSTDFGGIVAGGKFRLWAPRSGSPVVAVEPGIALPWGRPGGGTDYLLRIITGGALPRHLDLDVNYTVGAIAADNGAHFVQHAASASTNVSIGTRWNPYAELYWVSKLEPGARAVAGIDMGAIYTFRQRMAVDGGVAFGLTAAATGPAIFGGLSIIVGAVGGHATVSARMRDAQARGDR